MQQIIGPLDAAGAAEQTPGPILGQFRPWHQSCMYLSQWGLPSSGQPTAATETGGICMFITVLAIICLNVAVPGTCLTEPVVNSNQEQLTMGGCLGLLGFESAKEFWEHHPLYHTWKFKGWACQFGNRAPPERGKA
jgi:hypothetical protein